LRIEDEENQEVEADGIGEEMMRREELLMF
jgi:hypothetical protein